MLFILVVPRSKSCLQTSDQLFLHKSFIIFLSTCTFSVECFKQLRQFSSISFLFVIPFSFTVLCCINFIVDMTSLNKLQNKLILVCEQRNLLHVKCRQYLFIEFCDVCYPTISV